MLKKINVFSVLLLSVCIMAFTGCGSGQQKKNQENQGSVNSERIEAYKHEQQELLQKANARLSALNKKILELNGKINEKGRKLTEEQNNGIDAFDKKRASINQRIHQIKNVSYNDWEKFKTRFETDLDDCCADIDKLLAGL
jgi:peptidoglycan hydrolase CwlO-like protein